MTEIIKVYILKNIYIDHVSKRWFDIVRLEMLSWKKVTKLWKTSFFYFIIIIIFINDRKFQQQRRVIVDVKKNINFLKKHKCQLDILIGNMMIDKKEIIFRKEKRKEKFRNEKKKKENENKRKISEKNLQKFYNWCAEKLIEQQKIEFFKIIYRVFVFHDVFAKNSEEIGKCNVFGIKSITKNIVLFLLEALWRLLYNHRGNRWIVKKNVKKE